jgi:hypothetical protein
MQPEEASGSPALLQNSGMPTVPWSWAHYMLGLAIISHEIANTDANAGKPNQNHVQNSR